VVEQLIRNQQVVGSSPTAGSTVSITYRQQRSMGGGDSYRLATSPCSHHT
jgi:hypothetical protein